MTTKRESWERDIDQDTTDRVTVSLDRLALLERMALANLLASGLAHELANPLTAVFVGIEGIDNGIRGLPLTEPPDPVMREDLVRHLKLLRSGAESAGALIKDFQAFLVNESLPGAKPVDPWTALGHAIRMVRHRIDHVAHLDLVMGAAPLVRGPASFLTQICLNLLVNAIDALSDRSRESNHITVQLGASGGRAILDIHDNGPGIAAELAPRIFDAGVTSKTGGKRKGSALGMGLSISRQLARHLGGDLTVDVVGAPGTRFRVELPAV